MHLISQKIKIKIEESSKVQEKVIWKNDDYLQPAFFGSSLRLYSLRLGEIDRSNTVQMSHLNVNFKISLIMFNMSKILRENQYMHR